MKRCVFLIFFIGLLSESLLTGSKTYQWQNYTFNLTCANPRTCAKEKKTFGLLKSLIQQYNVSPWVRDFTINIQDGVNPRSNPLTINTRHNHDRLELLSIFLHEQIHLLQLAKKINFRNAMNDIEKMFPRLPKSLSDDPPKAYRHFIVIYFEFEALEILLGTDQAKSVLNGKPAYSWIQCNIYAFRDEIGQICRRHGLGF